MFKILYVTGYSELASTVNQAIRLSGNECVALVQPQPSKDGILDRVRNERVDAVIFDPAVIQHYGPEFLQSLEQKGVPVGQYPLPIGIDRPTAVGENELLSNIISEAIQGSKHLG